MGDHQAKCDWELHSGGDESIIGVDGHRDECVDSLQRLKKVCEDKKTRLLQPHPVQNDLNLKMLELQTPEQKSLKGLSIQVTYWPSGAQVTTSTR